MSQLDKLDAAARSHGGPHQIETAVDETKLTECILTAGVSREQAELTRDFWTEALGVKSSPSANEFKDAIAFILASPNPVNAAWGVAIASGFDVCEGRSIEDISAELTKRGLPVTKAGLSKAAYEFAELFNLPKSRYQRSDSAQEAYAERATKTHEAKSLATKPRKLPKSVSDADLATLHRLGIRYDATSMTIPDGADETTLRSVWAVLGKCNKALQWWIGDTAKATKKAKDQTWEEYAAEVGIYPYYAKNLAYVSEAVDASCRNDVLSWDHHRAVSPKLPDEQRYWLDQAVQHGLTVRELRDSIKAGEVIKSAAHLPDMGVDSIESWTGALMQRWERNVFQRMLPIAPKEKLTRWLQRLERPHQMYLQIKAKLGQ